jgi:hypothetical protein
VVEVSRSVAAKHCIAADGNLPLEVCVSHSAGCLSSHLLAVLCLIFIFLFFTFGGKLRAYALNSFVLSLLLTIGALGQTPGSRTYIGQDIFVAAGQQVHNATCLFCSVQVEGDATGHVFVLFGSVNVSGQVQKSATVIWGNAVVDSQARIGGDTVILGGNAVYEADESLGGSAYVLGGHLSHVSRVEGGGRHRVTMSPLFSGLLAVVVLLLLSLVIVPRLRNRMAVSQ